MSIIKRNKIQYPHGFRWVNLCGRCGVQLTWMDAKVGDWVVTPRIGKAVEINALWYNALKIMSFLAREMDLNNESKGL